MGKEFVTVMNLLIKPEFKLGFDGTQSHWIIKEESNEKADDTKLKKILIHADSESSFGFKVEVKDGKGPLSGYLRDDERYGTLKVCDAVLLSQSQTPDTNNEKYVDIYLIELKSTTSRKKHISQKFSATVAFVRYLFDLISEFPELFDSVKLHIGEKRDILFHTNENKDRLIANSNTRRDKRKYISRVAYNNQIFYLKELIGK